MRRQHTNGADTANQQGQFSFHSNETTLPTAAGRASTGNSFATFLLGAVDSASYNQLFVVPGLRYRYTASAANFGRVSSQANSPRQGLLSARVDF